MGDRNLRVLVCGGRDLRDAKGMWHHLDRLHADRGVAVLIHGGAVGADSLAGRWAAERGIDLTVFPANWQRHGTAAGPIRNARMLAEGKPDAVIAFPGGRGTANMIAQARKAGVPVWQPMEGKDG